MWITYLDLYSENVWGISFFLIQTTLVENYRRRLLSGILAKSGPLNFATKNSFPSFFFWKGFGTHVSKPLDLFSNSLFSPCYKPKTNFARNGVSGGDQKAEIYGF